MYIIIIITSVWLISVYQTTRRFFLWKKLSSPIAFSSTRFQIPPTGAMFQTVGRGTGGRGCMWVHRWEQCWSDRVPWRRLAPLLPCMACAFSIESVRLWHSPSLSPRPPPLAQEWPFPASSFFVLDWREQWESLQFAIVLDCPAECSRIFYVVVLFRYC